MNLCIFCLFSFVYVFFFLFFCAEYLGYLMIMLWFGSVKFCFWIPRKLIIFLIFLRRMLFPTLMPFHCFVMQVLVANPANTNALILKEFAPSIPEKNITCLTRLDHNRALSQIVERLKVYVTDVKNVI